MSNKTQVSQSQAAEGPQPTNLTPEQVVEQLRLVLQQIAEVEPLTKEERKVARRRGRLSNPVVQESISMIGASDVVAKGVGGEAEEVRQLFEETNRWTAVESELRTMLKGIADANILRRQRLSIIAAKAYLIGAQLARDPGDPMLRPHVDEIKRLRAIGRRKRAATSPQTPPADTPTSSNP